MRAVALIPAAGLGRRMGREKPKAHLLLAGVPLLTHTLKKFEACSLIDETLPLVPEGTIPFWNEEIRRARLKRVSRVLVGGPERQDSVYRGLKALGAVDYVMIHDGARPFIPVELIEGILRETFQWKAVVAGLPAAETMKEVTAEGAVRKTVDRSQLWMIQTPQSFSYDLILRAHERAREENFLGTDDSSLVERLGIPVRVVEGSRFNMKITNPDDLILGEALLKYLKDSAED